MKWNYWREKINYSLNASLSLKIVWIRGYLKNNRNIISLTRKNPDYNRSSTSCDHSKSLSNRKSSSIRRTNSKCNRIWPHIKPSYKNYNWSLIGSSSYRVSMSHTISLRRRSSKLTVRSQPSIKPWWLLRRRSWVAWKQKRTLISTLCRSSWVWRRKSGQESVERCKRSWTTGEASWTRGTSKLRSWGTGSRRGMRRMHFSRERQKGMCKR